MAAASVIAICIAAFMILPVYNALKLGKFDFTTPDYSYKSQFNIFEFITQFSVVNQYSSVNVQGKPEIYCGVLAAICMPLFFLNPRIKVRRKLGYGFLTVVMFICMLVRPIDMLWHGGQMPNWLPFRYSFIVSFILLSVAATAWKHLDGVQMKHLGGVFFGVRRSIPLRAVGAVIGSFVFRPVYALALRLHMPAFMLKAVSALIVVIAISAPYLTRQVKLLRRRRAANQGRGDETC